MHIVIHGYLCLLYYQTGSCPSEVYLQRLFYKRYAKHWNEIGVELKVDISVLENLRENFALHHNKTEECCKGMIKQWLRVDASATWEKLFKAIDNIEAITQASLTFSHKS